MKTENTASFQSAEFRPFDPIKFAKLLQSKERKSRWQLFWNGIEQKRKEIRKEILQYTLGKK
jgi:hypothetical protein